MVRCNRWYLPEEGVGGDYTGSAQPQKEKIERVAEVQTDRRTDGHVVMKESWKSKSFFISSSSYPVSWKERNMKATEAPNNRFSSRESTSRASTPSISLPLSCC